jgi:hypothetical protein
MFKSYKIRTYLLNLKKNRYKINLISKGNVSELSIILKICFRNVEKSKKAEEKTLRNFSGDFNK